MIAIARHGSADSAIAKRHLTQQHSCISDDPYTQCHYLHLSNWQPLSEAQLSTVIYQEIADAILADTYDRDRVSWKC